MGVDFRDIDNDGRPDLFITALTNETFPYYHNEGGGIFDDFTRRSELARLSITMSGWSNGIYDLNNDGWKDLFSVNSYIEDIDHIITNYPYRQRNAVFANRGGRFVDHSGGARARLPGGGRPPRAAPSEIWTTTGGSTSWPPASTSRRESFATCPRPANTGCWVELVGTRSNRDGIGAKLVLESGRRGSAQPRNDQRRIWRFQRSPRPTSAWDRTIRSKGLRFGGRAEFGSN